MIVGTGKQREIDLVCLDDALGSDFRAPLKSNAEISKRERVIDTTNGAIHIIHCSKRTVHVRAFEITVILSMAKRMLLPEQLVEKQVIFCTQPFNFRSCQCTYNRAAAFIDPSPDNTSSIYHYSEPADFVLKFNHSVCSVENLVQRSKESKKI